ncbi:hypothetical protein [Marisediminicola sp. LYQ85]|uniref:hypothetical protein n=1 Tax=Marisediminicola sp. LYQ85 TaxID=3391062 RepID=UPI003983B9CE
MIISIPRSLIITLAAIFSAYHLVLAAVSFDVAESRGPVIAAMVIYAAATTASLLPYRSPRMPIWLAAFNVIATIAISLLVTSQLPDGPGESYAAWHTAAIGTLMVITSTRMRQSFAWVGVGVLVAQSIAWQGVGELADLGIVGSVVWVGISHALAYSLAAAARDARQYALAEREAAEWRAAQEAHVFERQFRLGQTARMATPMLRQIVASGGNLTEEERQECLYLEGAIRDEIRGRTLLNDRVRAAVMASRRRGTTVTLLDEGGIDDLPDDERDRVLDRLAVAVEETRTDRIVVRTVPVGSDIAVTVVGLSSGNDGIHSLLGHEPDDDDDGDEIDLWLEIPRVGAAATAV